MIGLLFSGLAGVGDASRARRHPTNRPRLEQGRSEWFVRVVSGNGQVVPAPLASMESICSSF